MPSISQHLNKITVPDQLQRNDPDVLTLGIEETGQILLNSLATRIGRGDLKDLALLDIGCGVRFTQTLINRRLAFGSYAGIDVSHPIITWLQDNVQAHDDRFHFVHWNVQNAMYNRAAPKMASYNELPVSGSYDIVMGYSLFTHLGPEDATRMLNLTRKVISDSGHLFLTAFCDESVERFEDRVPDRPLLNAYYNPSYLETLIRDTGWRLLSHCPPGSYMMDSFLCQPAIIRPN